MNVLLIVHYTSFKAHPLYTCVDEQYSMLSRLKKEFFVSVEMPYYVEEPPPI